MHKLKKKKTQKNMHRRNCFLARFLQDKPIKLSTGSCTMHIYYCFCVLLFTHPQFPRSSLLLRIPLSRILLCLCYSSCACQLKNERRKDRRLCMHECLIDWYALSCKLLAVPVYICAMVIDATRDLKKMAISSPEPSSPFVQRQGAVDSGRKESTLG